jgi:hypothetical protein
MHLLVLICSQHLLTESVLRVCKVYGPSASFGRRHHHHCLPITGAKMKIPLTVVSDLNLLSRTCSCVQHSWTILGTLPTSTTNEHLCGGGGADVTFMKIRVKRGSPLVPCFVIMNAWSFNSLFECPVCFGLLSDYETQVSKMCKFTICPLRAHCPSLIHEYGSAGRHVCW